MSANHITANQAVEYLCGILNIDIQNSLILTDMIDDLKEIHDLAKFRLFVKERFNYERFNYLTGYQKFIKLVQEFKKENKPRLSIAGQDKAYSYSQKLFSKVTTILDEVNFTLQEEGKTIDDLDLEKTLTTNGLKDHHIIILRGVGDKKKLFHLSVYGKEELRLKIESIVNQKTLEKEYPQLVKPKSAEALVLGRIKNG